MHSFSGFLKWLDSVWLKRVILGSWALWLWDTLLPSPLSKREIILQESTHWNTEILPPLVKCPLSFRKLVSFFLPHLRPGGGSPCGRANDLALWEFAYTLVSQGTVNIGAGGVGISCDLCSSTSKADNLLSTSHPTIFKVYDSRY